MSIDFQKEIAYREWCKAFTSLFAENETFIVHAECSLCNEIDATRMATLNEIARLYRSKVQKKVERMGCSVDDLLYNQIKWFEEWIQSNDDYISHRDFARHYFGEYFEKKWYESHVVYLD